MERLIIITLFVAAVVFGGPFLVPIIIAALLTILISATEHQIRKLGLPRPAALICALLLFLLILSSIPLAILDQVDTIKLVWPSYVERFSELVAHASNWLGPDLSSRFVKATRQIDLSQSLPTLLGSAGSLLTTCLLVALYTAFMLSERSTVRLKIKHMCESNEQASGLLDSLNETVSGVRDYLWIKSIMSALTAILSYAVLKVLGVNFAETWAILIFLLNFIPNIGAVVGAIFPAILALIQFDTVWQFLVIAICLSGVQFFLGNVVEPRVMGRTLNLSPFVVMASLAFWSLTWGIVGAFLSVPLTATLVIICSKLPDWRWLAVLLSEDGKVDEI